MAPGTDSSGELFVNGDVNWASDVSEAARNLRRERDGGSAKSYLGDEFEEEEDQRLLSGLIRTANDACRTLREKW
nr:uncharacterized protein LOC109191297 [Ipomoea trifida]